MIRYDRATVEFILGLIEDRQIEIKNGRDDSRDPVDLLERLYTEIRDNTGHMWNDEPMAEVE